jgi:hypothetical protein
MKKILDGFAEQDWKVKQQKQANKMAKMTHEHNDNYYDIIHYGEDVYGKKNENTLLDIMGQEGWRDQQKLQSSKYFFRFAK